VYFKRYNHLAASDNQLELERSTVHGSKFDYAPASYVQLKVWYSVKCFKQFQLYCSPYNIVELVFRHPAIYFASAFYRAELSAVASFAISAVISV